MSSSVWYLSFSRKKIQFKKYPKKVRKTKHVSKSKSGSLNSDKKFGKIEVK